MDDTICYRNTDLDLISSEDLAPLAAAFEAQGVSPLRVWLDNNGKWRATLETDDHHEEPELNISSMIAVVESFPDHLRAVWFDCSCREFNIGYECGVKPWGFDQTLSDSLLGRMAAVGASLRITLYPPECEASAENRPTPDRRRS